MKLNLKQRSFASIAFFAAIAASAVQGTNAVANKIAFESMDPIVFTSLRHIAIGVVLALFIRNAKHLLSGKPLIHLIINSLITLFVMVTLAIGINLSTAINAAILSLALPIFIYLFAVIFLREPVIKRVIAGGLLAMLGSLLIIGLPALLNRSFEMGDVVLLLSYIGLAAMIVHTKYIYKYLTTMEVLGVRFLFGGVVFRAYVLLFMDVSFTQGDTTAWFSLVYSIIVTGIIATVVYYYSLRHIKAEYAAPIFYIDPMVGVMTAAIVLQEQLTTSAIVGTGFIVIGVMISHVHLTRLMHRVHFPTRKQRIKRYMATHWR